MSGQRRARIVELQQIRDDTRGALSIATSGAEVPFTVQRAFTIYDLPPGVVRGGHAHRRCEQFLICAAGEVGIETEDLQVEASFRLDTPARGLYLPPLTWVMLTPVEPGTVVVVLASAAYDEADYIRIYSEFEALK